MKKTQNRVRYVTHIVMFLIMMLIAGCASIRVDKPGVFDARFKSMCVPPGYGMLNGDIKRALKVDGWELYSMQRGRETTTLQDKKMETEWDPRARYRLLINYHQVDLDILLRPLYNFEISILDNKTGEEVIAISGTYETGSAIVHELRKQLQN